MFGLVSNRAYDEVALDLECERIHFRKEIEYAHEAVETARMENTCLKVANRELVKKLDNCLDNLKSAEERLKDVNLKLQSLEARWGNGACI